MSNQCSNKNLVIDWSMQSETFVEDNFDITYFHFCNLKWVWLLIETLKNKFKRYHIAEISFAIK